MKITFQNLVNSEACNSQAEAWSKAHIAVAFAVAAYVAFFSHLSIGWHWLWIVPFLLFASSLLIAMPTMIINVWLASLMSPHMNYEIGQLPTIRNRKALVIKLIKDIWSGVALVIEALIVYKFLEWIGT